jgi:hypothetical protein
MHPEFLGIDDRIWLVACLASTHLFHFLNRKPRAAVDRAVAPLKVPERRLGYSGEKLEMFRAKALEAGSINGQNVLDYYRRTVLLIDLGFAVSLAAASYFLWCLAVPTMGPSALLNWVSTMGWMLSLFYGGFDLGEDAGLYFLLKRDPTYSRAVPFASGCTLGKMIAIAGSLFGLATFLTLALIDWTIAKSDARARQGGLNGTRRG